MNAESKADWPRRAETWWTDWSPDASIRHGGRERAAFARLRRARDPIDALAEPATLDLLRRLTGANPDRVATLALVLAHVRASTAQPIAKAIGRRSIDDKDALVSEGRFRRLLQSDDDELADAMRRIVRFSKGQANVRDLSASVLYWGDGVRKRWIFDYYAVSARGPNEPEQKSATDHASAD